MYQSARSLPGTFSTSLGSAPPVQLSPPPASLPRSNREILFVVELFYWIPALLTAIHVLRKQGIRKHCGWFCIVALALIRVGGACAGIASIHSHTSGLIDTSIICTHLGLIILIIALTSIILFTNKRISNFSPTSHKLLTHSTLLELLNLASITLTIVGGTTHSHVLTKLSLAITSSVVLGLSFLTVHTDTHMHSSCPSEARLTTVCLASLPFILVRLVYGCLSSFTAEGGLFDFMSARAGAVMARATMQVAVEVVVMTLYLLMGMAEEKEWDEVEEMGGSSSVEGMAMHGRAAEMMMVEADLGLREMLVGKGTITGIAQEEDEALGLLR